MKSPLDNRFRLDNGGAIDRTKPLKFQFNGKAFTGYEGDTLASALLANGVKTIARSFKYHRPRGVFSAGEEEPCALVEIGEGAYRVPNCRATQVPLQNGLVARSQNAWPSVDFDVGRMVDWTHGLWPAGFYNKTFKWPNWHFWEGMIRRSAGIGRPLNQADPDRYEQMNAHCDLLICGGGPAGLVAARSAANAGLRVVLADQDCMFGGSLTGELAEFDGQPAHLWVEQVVKELTSNPGVILLNETTVSGIYDHSTTTLVQKGRNTHWRECYWTVRPRHILITAGAIEQGLIFPDNDRPGIMLASAVRRYLSRFAVRPGQQAVIATNNDTAYQTAFDLVAQQVPVAAVVDSRAEVDAALKERLSDLGVPLHTRATVQATSGYSSLKGVTVDSAGSTKPVRLNCDLLAVSGGWAPRVHLLAHARGALRFDNVSQSFVPDRLPQGISVAGSANGTASLQDTLVEASRMAENICASLGAAMPSLPLPRVTRSPIASAGCEPQNPQQKAARQWIDLAHDVTLGDAELAAREGFTPVEHFKRYTTTGMSVDQGKTGNINAFIVLGALSNRVPGEVGTTTYRPPYMPVSLGTVAASKAGGRQYAPLRYLPAHDVHERLDATFDDYGWLRPEYYPLRGESPEQAINREVLAVRNHVGVFDNSPIGKLEVRGPDAAEFLDRIYMNQVHSLAPGRARYGLMLNEKGVIIDDGVFIRLGDDHFLVNTTSAGLAGIHLQMEERLQCEWPDLEVLVDNVTSQWCNFTVAGPNAVNVIENLLRSSGRSFDRNPLELSHMSACTGEISGQGARIVRVSFSGEVSFEVNAPSATANALLTSLLDVGAAENITPYGIEALMLLRAEKGYLHVGTETDGTTLPDDIGWGAAALRKPGDFIGKRSLQSLSAKAEGRKQLVGLESLDGQRLLTGSHVLLGEGRKPPGNTDGWITFSAVSPTLQKPIALAMVAGGRVNQGAVVTVCESERQRPARIVSPVFYDPENSRLGPTP